MQDFYLKLNIFGKCASFTAAADRKKKIIIKILWLFLGDILRNTAKCGRELSHRGDKVSVMRRVVETTCVILRHVTHSNNHFIMKRDVCGGETEAEEEESWSHTLIFSGKCPCSEVHVLGKWPQTVASYCFLNGFLHCIGNHWTEINDVPFIIMMHISMHWPVVMSWNVV